MLPGSHIEVAGLLKIRRQHDPQTLLDDIHWTIPDFGTALAALVSCHD